MDAYQNWLMFRQKLKLFAETILADAEIVDLLIQYNPHLEPKDLVGTKLDLKRWAAACEEAKKLLERLDRGTEVHADCLNEIKKAFANVPTSKPG